MGALNYTPPDPTSFTNPLKAIRAKCIDCYTGNVREVELCTATSCPIYFFRFGKNPYRTKKVLSEEHKKALREGIKKSNKTK